jgi:GDSL-like Lipase/Acylhydrolase family
MDRAITRVQVRGPSRKVLSIVVLVVAATGVALLVAEGAMRLIESRLCRDRFGGFAVRSRLWGWGHRPGARGWAQGCYGAEREWRTWVRINDHGLRGADLPYERTGAFRVLVLGDSFTAAVQVAEDESYTQLLQQRLADFAPPGSRVEVLNAGVNGWGTDNELLFFQHEGWKYRPDLVLLAFDTKNDVFENMRELAATTPFGPDKPYFRLLDGRLVRENHPLPPARVTRRVLEALTGPLVLHSALFRTVANVPAIRNQLLIPGPTLLGTGGPADAMGVHLVSYPPVWRDAWRVTRGIVLALRREVARRGARFAVVVINGREVFVPNLWKLAVGIRPALRGVATDPEKPDRLITGFLARRGIPTIPLMDAFRAAAHPDGSPLHFVWDMHWAPAGHVLAAKLIAEGLQRRGLLPPQWGSRDAGR